MATATPTQSVSFKVGKDDVLALSSHYYDMSASVRRIRLASQIVLALISLVLALLLLLQGHDFTIAGIEFLVGAGISIFLFPILHRRALRWTAGKLLSETSYQKAFGDYTLTFSDTGLTCASPVGEAKYNWRAIDRVALTPDYLFIFFAGPQGIPVSTAQIPAATLQQLATFAESQIRALSSAIGPGLKPAVGN